jgi:hypothetical protein
MESRGQEGKRKGKREQERARESKREQERARESKISQGLDRWTYQERAGEGRRGKGISGKRPNCAKGEGKGVGRKRTVGSRERKRSH